VVAVHQLTPRGRPSVPSSAPLLRAPAWLADAAAVPLDVAGDSGDLAADLSRILSAAAAATAEENAVAAFRRECRQQAQVSEDQFVARMAEMMNAQTQQLQAEAAIWQARAQEERVQEAATLRSQLLDAEQRLLQECSHVAGAEV